MNRRLFLMGLPGLAGCGGGRPRLNVLNWSDYVAPETIPAFEAEYGVRVRYGLFESAEEMLARVQSGNSGWDVVFPPNNYIAPMREAGLLEPLRHDRLGNLRHLDPMFRAPAWDPRLEWCVPFMWGGTGIVYQRALAPAPSAWADLWSERLRGRVTMLDDSVEVFAACLKKLGLSVNSTDPAELGRAREEAIAQKRVLRAYLSAEVRDQLVAGDVLAAQLWRTTAQLAIDAAPDRLAFVYPAEGYPLYADNVVILRECGRGDLAHQFIDYLLRPAVAAAIVTAVKSGTANGAARALLAPALREDPTLYPPPETLARGEWLMPMPAPAQRLRDRLWTEIKSA